MSVAEAWWLLADTDHLNRAIGLPPVDFSPPSESLLRRARARAFGIVQLRWTESPFDWVREHRYVVRREFENGPMASIVGGIELLPADDCVIVRSFAEFTPRNVAGRLLWRLGRGPVTDLLEYCDRYLVRKAMGKADPQPVPRTPPTVDGDRLEALLDELAARRVQDTLIPLLRERIVEGSDDQLVRMRAFGVADAWNAGRLEVLRLFLHASRIGLLGVRWELMCPNCRVPKAEVNELSDVPTRYHCDTCGISYDTDFDERVELRFAVHPAVRVADEAVYCVAGPARAPHVLAQQYLRPRERRAIKVAATGPLRLRTVPPTHELGVLPSSSDEHVTDVEARYANDRWVGGNGALPDHPLSLPTGASLQLCNETDFSVLAVLEDAAWTTDATTAAQVTTMQEFKDLFGSEVLAPGHELAVRSIALMFSDLRGSTRLYEGFGDAVAYGRVNRHFDLVRDSVTRAGGNIVKTIGDGVMCAFHRLEDALGAAIEMQELLASWCQEEGIDPALVLKIGVHVGPAIAVTANGHLDYFGRTVNIAARLADKSDGHDIVLLRDVLDRAAPVPAIEHADVALESFTAQLRGIDADQQLVRVMPRPTSSEDGRI